MGIDACCGCVRYVLGGRADGEGGRGKRERETIIINSIEVVIAIVIYIPPLIALYYIWGLVLRYVSLCL